MQQTVWYSWGMMASLPKLRVQNFHNKFGHNLLMWIKVWAGKAYLVITCGPGNWCDRYFRKDEEVIICRCPLPSGCCPLATYGRSLPMLTKNSVCTFSTCPSIHRQFAISNSPKHQHGRGNGPQGDCAKDRAGFGRSRAAECRFSVSIAGASGQSEYDNVDVVQHHLWKT